MLHILLSYDNLYQSILESSLIIGADRDRLSNSESLWTHMRRNIIV